MARAILECPYNSGCKIAGGYQSDLCIASVGGGACEASVKKGFRKLCELIHNEKQTGKAVDFFVLVQKAPRLQGGALNPFAIHRDPLSHH